MMKQKQKGSAIIAVMVGFLILLVVSASVIVYAFSIRNQFVSLENRIVATYDNMKNMNSQYTLTIKNMVQIPALATRQMSELVDKALNARYGEDGSKALMQFIKEQNPNIPPELYTNIQKTMTGGSADFQNMTTTLIDTKRVAIDKLDSMPAGFFLKLMGMPRKNIGYNNSKDDYPVIMSEQSVETFKTGIDKGFDIK